MGFDAFPFAFSGGTGAVESVQTGIKAITAGSSSRETHTQTITAIDTSRAIVMMPSTTSPFPTTYTGTYTTNLVLTYAEITDSTTITFTTHNASGTSHTVNVPWQVIEYTEGSGGGGLGSGNVTVARYTHTIASVPTGSITSSTDTITSVDTTKTFLNILGHQPQVYQASYSTANISCTAVLTSATQVTFSFHNVSGTSQSNVDIEYEVITLG